MLILVSGGFYKDRVLSSSSSINVASQRVVLWLEVTIVHLSSPHNPQCIFRPLSAHDSAHSAVALSLQSLNTQPTPRQACFPAFELTIVWYGIIPNFINDRVFDLSSLELSFWLTYSKISNIFFDFYLGIRLFPTINKYGWCTSSYMGETASDFDASRRGQRTEKGRKTM